MQTLLIFLCLTCSPALIVTDWPGTTETCNATAAQIRRESTTILCQSADTFAAEAQNANLKRSIAHAAIDQQLEQICRDRSANGSQQFDTCRQSVGLTNPDRAK